MSSEKVSSTGGIGSKRKHLTLSIAQKIELLRRHENGTPLRHLINEYGIGSSTIYDLKKQKEKLMKFYADSDTPIVMTKRKTLRQAKSVDVDKVLFEWFRQRRSEGVSITGPMLISQAKAFHEELKITQPCDYSKGWLQNFKLRHGIQSFVTPSEPATADSDAALKYIDEFAKLVLDENLSPVQIYNADETGLFWQCLPQDSTIPSKDEVVQSLEVEKERLTVLACSNAAGTHKCKLLVVGKTLYPNGFDGIKMLPVNYCASEDAWITPQIMVDWFENYFIPEAQAHCKTMGLDDNCKIVLILDNCPAHPDMEVLNKDNVFVVFLPLNCTSLIQPMDQGITRSLKYFYRALVIKRLINTCKDGVSVDAFRKKYNLKDAVWALSRAWDEVTPDILKNAWYNLWPAFMFDESEIRPELDSTPRDKKIVADLLELAKKTKSDVSKDWQEGQLLLWMNVDNHAPVVQPLSNKEIMNMALSPSKNKFSIDDSIQLGEDFIASLKQRNFISEEEIDQVYKIHEKLVEEKANFAKHVRLQDIFKKVSHPYLIRTLTSSPVTSSSSLPSTSTDRDSPTTILGLPSPM